MLLVLVSVYVGLLVIFKDLDFNNISVMRLFLTGLLLPFYHLLGAGYLHISSQLVFK